MTTTNDHQTSSVSGLSSWGQRLASSPVPVITFVFIVVFVFFSFSAPNFLSFYVLSNILTFASVYGIIVVGVGFLMISGEFDLSVGSVLAVSGYVFVWQRASHVLHTGSKTLFVLRVERLSCAHQQTHRPGW